jgi:hypothetical protein
MDGGGWPGLRLVRGLPAAAVAKIEPAGLVVRVVWGAVVRLVAAAGCVPAAALLSGGLLDKPWLAAGGRGTVLERLVREEGWMPATARVLETLRPNALAGGRGQFSFSAVGRRDLGNLLVVGFSNWLSVPACLVPCSLLMLGWLGMREPLAEPDPLLPSNPGGSPPWGAGMLLDIGFKARCRVTIPTWLSIKALRQRRLAGPVHHSLLEHCCFATQCRAVRRPTGPYK